MKLALGTVQFGQPYGVANRRGQPAETEVARILEEALAHGVRVIDTARLYGEAEAVLGRHWPSNQRFNVVSKTPKFAGLTTHTARHLLDQSLADSLAQLKLTTLYGLLVHDADDLLGPLGDALWQRLSHWRGVGCVQHIGASVYRGEQIDALLARYPLQLVQLPLNIVDQRLLQGGQLGRLAQAGVEIHARSVFLQGALLMAPRALPPALSALAPHLAALQNYAGELKISVLQAALGFVSAQTEVAALVCGVDTLAQFAQLVSAARSVADLPPATFGAAAALTIQDTRLVDPSQWSNP